LICDDDTSLDEPLFLYAPFEATHGAASCDPDCYAPYGDLLQVNCNKNEAIL
jgi:hypothetical protein